MPITNSDKPNVGTPETYLEIGSGYSFLIGGIYKLIIGAASLGGITNIAKIASFEVWDTITTTWASETRTWDDCLSLFDGFNKPSTSITNTAKPTP